MEQMRELIANRISQLYGQEVPIVFTRPDEQFGDFSTNVAMQLASKVGSNPREIAQSIIDNLSHDDIAKAEVAGPGFINLTLSDQALTDLIAAEPTKIFAEESVVIETNNPNPFKAMHIGHAFNAIVADTLANLIEAAGAHTYRVSYHGDVGLHVGKSMYSLLRYVDGEPNKLLDVPEEERNSFMSRMYAEGSAAYKEDGSLDSGARAEIDELARQSFTREDATYAAVYEICRDWSFEQIDTNVARLGNKPVERRFLESDAEHRGVEIVKKNTPAVFKESDGALIFEGSKHGTFDNAFVSARGTGLYASRDLGLIQLKNEQYHPDKSYIVTAEEQRDYFKGVIAAAELCMPDQKGVTINIPTGTVKLTTGKMSSRDGDVVEIGWLFDQVASAIKERGGSASDQDIAGALRYQFLQVRIGSDVVFDIENSVSIHGNSGPYLQYAHARARSILRKAQEVESEKLKVESLQKAERSLVRKIGEYNEVVGRAADELMPHHICHYLHELSQNFNSFYEHNRVIGDAREGTRLKIVELYADTLKRGLELLGINAPEQM